MGRGIMLPISAGVAAVTAAATERRTLVWLAVGAATALALLLALLVLAVRRTRVSPVPATAGPDPAESSRRRGAPRPLPLPRRDRRADPPRRTATVRTGLHPQGYVELDHCLHRAEWTDSGTPPPAPGAPVDVTDRAGADPARTAPAGASGHADVLFAVPCRPRPPAGDEHT
ncbi:hypothetical protein OG288_32865 [Streptomyces tauricus]|uniref:Uncharacterized protein n=1 Tax=Streptomyces tauricus TaxID=68274 RepID=A0ABZ1JRG7_9ACTN|nr:hypothetical protein [Streptomyces tauricus]MCW8100528.1 hypothetical protein [Streptomyces tauricus]